MAMVRVKKWSPRGNNTAEKRRNYFQDRIADVVATVFTFCRRATLNNIFVLCVGAETVVPVVAGVPGHK
jgi:hypothetical protein